MKKRLVILATSDQAEQFPPNLTRTEPASILPAEVKSLLADADTEVAYFSGTHLVTNSVPIRVLRQFGWAISRYSDISLGDLAKVAEILFLVFDCDLNTEPEEWNWRSSIVNCSVAAT